MSTGPKLRKFARVFVLCIVMACLPGLCFAHATSGQTKRRAKKPAPPPPPLPSGPTGQLQPIPLDSILPVPPQVMYQNGQLTIIAPNSTLADILKAVRKQTGAEIEIPSATDRVVTRLGPGPAQEVMADLLNGSRFNYVVLGSPQDPNQLTRVVLVPKTGIDVAATQPANQPPQIVDEAPQPGLDDANNADANSADDTSNDVNNAEQPTEAEQPAPAQEQPGVKTPQQMLQEMQQRQLQLQQQMQQQQSGQQPNPYVVPPPQPPEQ